MAKANYVEINGQFYAPNHAVAIAHRKRMAGLPDPKREPRAVQALDKGAKEHRSRKAGMGIIVTITSYRHRELDSDNLIAGAKGLRDAISRSLCLDDGDKRLTWEYRTVVTTGAIGTHVTIITKP